MHLMTQAKLSLLILLVNFILLFKNFYIFSLRFIYIFLEPKAKITTTFNHEAVIKTPVHVGTDVQRKSVNTMNRLTGKIESHTVETRKPVLAVLKTVRNVQSNHVTTVDMTNGKIMKGGEPKIKHGKF